MKKFNFQTINFEKINLKLLQILVYFFIIIICLTLFSISILRQFPDIPDHNSMAYGAFHGKQILQVHFLYFVILMLPQLLSDNIYAVHVFSVMILTLSVIWKYRISQKILSSELIVESYSNRISKKVLDVFVIGVPFLLLLSQNIIYKPSATMFLGFIPINIWHNSTTIFLMPFALLLFYKSYNYLLLPEVKKLWLLLLLILLNLIIKPSFFMSFVIAFPLFCLLRFGFSKNFFYGLFICFIGAIGLLAESMIGTYIGTTVITIKISPFNVWLHWSDNIPLSFLASLLFPLGFIFLYFKEVKNDLLLKYSIGLFIAAIIVYILLSESGNREFDSNFVWQVIICNYILFLTSIPAFSRELLKKEKFSFYDKLLIFIFFMHVFTGLIYIFKSLIWGFR